MWRKGFHANRYYYYDLDRSDSRDYVSDLFIFLCHPFNGRFSSLIDNKVYLPIYLRGFPEHVPEYYCLLSSDRIIKLNGDRAVLPKDDAAFWDSLIDIVRGRRCVAKPTGGKGGGSGVFVLEARSDTLLMNNKPCGRDDLISFLMEKDGYLIGAFIPQHPYAVTLNPTTTNTVRLLTCWDYESNTPFIARGVQRIGRQGMYAADNAALGGLVTQIDLDSGTLGHIAHRSHGPVKYIKNHPDSGVPVYGTKIPHFEAVKTDVIRMCYELNFIPYMGWDIVITEDSFKVLEVNSLSDVYIYQLFEPLLTDERLRRFYRRYVTPKNRRYFER